MLRRPEDPLTRPFELPRRPDLVAMLRLAIPVVVVQVGMMLMGVVDTMVVGRVSPKRSLLLPSETSRSWWCPGSSTAC